MKAWPQSSLSSLFDDWIVYRSLTPLDKRVPGLQETWRELGLRSNRTPRKAKDPEYVRVILQFLERIQAARGHPPLQRLIYLGNRQSRDQATLAHLEQHCRWSLATWLCEEDADIPNRSNARGPHMLSNRWEGILDFAAFLAGQGFSLNAQTAIVVDMDKTIIAARGRNSDALNHARVEGVKQMVKATLGDSFEEPRFQAVYYELNQPKYHFFTEDNQDYVTYIALMASALVYPIEDLLEDVAYGQVNSFGGILEIVERRLAKMPQPGLQALHEEVWTHFLLGDPTVFKSFRGKQYESILAHINPACQTALDEETLLKTEIVITREVFDFLQLARERGTLLFLISDRPDETLIPDAALAQQGYQPIHRLPIKIVGKPVYARLAQMNLP